MSKTIFMVEGTSGEYSDRTEWPICAFTSEEKATELVAQLNELEKFNAEFHSRIRPEFEEPYEADHPSPSGPVYPGTPPGFHAAQLACSSGRGGPQEKKLFKELQVQHQKNLEVHQAAYRKWSVEVVQKHNDDHFAAKQAWFNENYNPPNHLTEAAKYLKYDGNGYRGYDSRYYHYSVELFD